MDFFRGLTRLEYFVGMGADGWSGHVMSGESDHQREPSLVGLKLWQFQTPPMKLGKTRKPRKNSVIENILNSYCIVCDCDLKNREL